MSSATHDIIFSIAAEMSAGFAKSFYKAKDTITELNQQWAKTSKSLKAVDGVIQSRKAIDEQLTAVKKAKDQLAYYQAESEKAKGKNEYLTNKVKESKLAFESANRSLRKQSDALRLLEERTGTTGVGLAALKKRQDELTQATKKYAREQDYLHRKSVIQNQKQASLAAIGEGLGQIATVKSLTERLINTPLQSAMSVEDTMAEIRKVADDETVKKLHELQAGLDAMTFRVPKSFQELGAITASAAQSGIEGKDNLLEFTEKASQMAVAFGMTADSAGDMMAKWKSGLNLDLGKVYELADIVNTMSNKNAALAKQIGGVIMRSGAFASSAGLNEKHLVALAGSLIGAGATEETAATGIEAIMREATKGALMNDRQKAAFMHLGFDPKTLQMSMKKDASGTLLKILENLQSKIPEEMRTMYLTATFGDVGSKALSPLVKNIAMLKANIELASDATQYGNSMLAEFKARASTTSNALILMKNATDAVVSTIGQPMLEPIKALSVVFIEYAKSIAVCLSEHQDQVKTALTILTSITGMTVALASARIAFHAVRYAIAPVIGAYTWLTKSQMASTLATKAWTAACAVAGFTGKAFVGVLKFMALGMKGFGLALRFMFLNPIGLAITAISALIAGAVWLYKKWGSIKKSQAIVKPEIEKAMQSAMEVPAFANGGIVTGPTLAMVGEGRESEAILPLSKLDGMLTNRSGHSNVVVNLSVHVDGVGSDAYADVKRGIAEGSANLKVELERLLNNQRRLSYV